jgi:hypothetical protein
MKIDLHTHFCPAEYLGALQIPDTALEVTEDSSSLDA